jgi:hypothetical protein
VSQYALGEEILRFAFFDKLLIAPNQCGLGLRDDEEVFQS